MGRRLLTVESTYYMEDLAIVPFPGYRPQPGELIQIADDIIIKRPDGTELQWTIAGVELTYPPGSTREPRPDVLIALTSLDRETLPVGSEIWTI